MSQTRGRRLPFLFLCCRLPRAGQLAWGRDCLLDSDSLSLSSPNIRRASTNYSFVSSPRHHPLLNIQYHPISVLPSFDANTFCRVKTKHPVLTVNGAYDPVLLS
jgi:hypothetical protein